jgi:TRAP-type C4-dicarboxylate transport system substrate-binding protein
MTTRARKLATACAAALMSIATALGAGSVAAQDKPLTFRYTTGAPAKTPWVMQAERFVKDVDEESKSSLKIDLFIAAQLGNEQDTVQQIARGRIDMGGFSTGAVALLVPELALFQLPLYFKSIAELDCTLDTALSRPVTELLAKKGVQFLGWTEVGTVDIVGKKPFLSPKDITGLKAAANSNKVNAMFWQALGANPSFIGITEITSAFQTGLTDVNATVITFYVPSGLSKVANVLTRLDLWDAPGLIVMNKAVFDRMSKDQQAALTRAVQRRPAAQLRTEIRGFEDVLRGMHEKGGGTIVKATPEQRNEFRKVMEASWPKMVKEVGGDSERFFQVMEAGRKACEGKS